MSENKTPIDQRTLKRFRVQENVLAMASSKKANFLCNIDNISSAGVAFNYIAVTENPQEFSRLSILIGNAIFSLHNLPVQKQWCRELICGLDRRYFVGCRFTFLNAKQETELQEFIRNYTFNQ